MKTGFIVILVVCIMLITNIAWSDIIRVPGDYSTIQAGIDAAVDGDTVLVADGSYYGTNLDFHGKAITVTSENGPENCIINCGISSSGFLFHSGEETLSVVNGFTITGGGGYNGKGGGIYCEYSSPTITNNIITKNSVRWDGGGIYCLDSSPTIINNTITNNSTTLGDGGGICCEGPQSSTTTITNNTITENSAGRWGGGIYCFLYASFPSPTITNTILWKDLSGGEIWVDGTGLPITVTYSDIQGGYPGEGNIDADPLFGNPYSGYAYDLKPGSPCINKGTSSGAPSTDIVGRPRPSGSGVDIGAYEQNDEGTLAVELSSFTASITNDGVIIIRWRTEAEVNNLGFSIYRSESKDSNYTKIAFVSGAGNTGMPTDYQFKDTKVEPGKTYFYYLEDIDITGERNKSDVIKVVVPAKSVMPIPKEFALLQNFPNPFNPETWIPFKLAQDSSVTIQIYNPKGQLIRTITLGNRNAGIYTTKDKAVYWNGKDNLGEKVSSGVYFYQMQAGDFRATRKMVIVK